VAPEAPTGLEQQLQASLDAQNAKKAAGASAAAPTANEAALAKAQADGNKGAVEFCAKKVEAEQAAPQFVDPARPILAMARGPFRPLHPGFCPAER